jgi:excisionase family DNA binding protein
MSYQLSLPLEGREEPMQPPKIGDRPTFSTGQVAAMLGMHADTVQKWCRSGKIKAFRTPGGQFRITEEALREMMGLPAK